MKTKVSIFIFILMTLIGLGSFSSVFARSYTSDSEYGSYYSSEYLDYQVPYYTGTRYYTSYQNQYQTRNVDDLYQEIERLTQELQYQQYNSGYYYDYDDYSDYDDYRDMDVTTLSSKNIDDESALLRGEVDYESGARGYFEYGTNRNSLDDTTSTVSLRDDIFEIRVRGLESDETYYFRAVVKDRYGSKSFGFVKSFSTDESNRSNDDTPDVQTESADNIDRSSADLVGDVDMNDFNRGQVFFIYGEDRVLVNEIENEYSEYSDIDEDGDSLRKISVDSSLDTSNTYRVSVRSLDRDTEYYFALCVAYDNDGETISCGITESFTTD